jgi:hypothetical protein
VTAHLPGALVAGLLLAGAAACGDDGSVDDEGALTPGELAPVTVPPPLEEAPQGRGMLSIGGLLREFEVEVCEAPADGSELLVRGEGRTDTDIPFVVEVQQVVAGDDPSTTSELVTYEDTARILHAQRAEVTGTFTDLRVPDADGPLLRLRDSGVSGRGIAGPPGSREGEEGLVGIAVDVTC